MTSILEAYYMQINGGFLCLDDKGWLRATNDRYQATHFLDGWQNGNTYITVVSGKWEGRYLGIEWDREIGAYTKENCSYVKWNEDRLQSRSGRTSGHHLAFRLSNRRFYFYDGFDEDYRTMTVKKIRPFYTIAFKDLYAKFDGEGWLTVTHRVEDATLFRDYEHQDRLFVRIESGTWKGKYLGGDWQKGVGAYALGECDVMEWKEGRLKSASGKTRDYYMDFRPESGYFHFNDTGGILKDYSTKVKRRDLHSLIALYALLQQDNVGIITKDKAVECLERGQNCGEGVYVSSPAIVYRTTPFRWDQDAIESGRLLSKYDRLANNGRYDPRLTPEMVRDPNNLIVLAMRILALEDSAEPLSQFVPVTTSLSMAERFEGRIYSFSVVPYCPLFSEDKESQFLILGGAKISDVRIVRSY